jgi:hypothetical protein
MVVDAQVGRGGTAPAATVAGGSRGTCIIGTAPSELLMNSMVDT